MSNDNLPSSRLARLYRRCTRIQSGEPLPDVDALVAFAEGDRTPSAERLVSEAGRSGVHADLLRFARALAPESARLGVQLEHAFDSVAPGHRGANHGARRAFSRRGAARVAASLVAGIIVAVAVWGLQQRHAGAPLAAPTASAAPLASDRIFAAIDRRGPARGDRIFRAEFAPGRPANDQIFKGRFSRG